ncbi:MAG: endonuclease III [Deltaproteobacteria bacterium]|nr:endonuclease III [Deltaproteobacteria bacterium]
MPPSPTPKRAPSPTKKKASASGAASRAARTGPAAPSKKPAPVVTPERLSFLFATLDRLYPQAATALTHENPLQLLVATILSAQCTDERVNQVTPRLFATYPDARALAEAEPEALEGIIHSTGFFRAKAKSIRGACRLLCDRHEGKVPHEMSALLELPGVARKTANVVLGSAFGISSGVVVDTHVARLSGRLGLSHHTDPAKIEADLMALVPRERWIGFAHQLILHGRAVCAARKPACSRCALAPHCPSAEVGS